MAMAARMPMIATTIISSMSVKPRWLLRLVMGPRRDVGGAFIRVLLLRESYLSPEEGTTPCRSFFGSPAVSHPRPDPWLCVPAPRLVCPYRKGVIPGL